MSMRVEASGKRERSRHYLGAGHDTAPSSPAHRLVEDIKPLMRFPAEAVGLPYQERIAAKFRFAPAAASANLGPSSAANPGRPT
jgi:hypothetical protein